MAKHWSEILQGGYGVQSDKSSEQFVNWFTKPNLQPDPSIPLGMGPAPDPALADLGQVVNKLQIPWRGGGMPIFGGAGDWMEKAGRGEAQSPMENAFAVADIPLSPFGIGATIAGIGAKTAIPEAVKLAQTMKKAGATEDKIFRRTTDEFGQGWWLGHPDTRPRFEIDDSQSSLIVGDNPRTGPLSHYLGHEPLYKNYPEMESTGYAYRPGEGGGSYFPDQDLMIVRSNDPGSAKSTTLHEGQHAVSGKEGFSSGGSPDQLQREYNDARARLNFLESDPDYIEASRKMNKVFDDAFSEKITLDEAREIENKIYAEYPTYKEGKKVVNTLSELGDDSGYDAYRRLADESQARLTQSRMDMTAAERAAPGNEFYKHYDVPLNEMILRYDRGPNAMASSGGLSKDQIAALRAEANAERFGPDIDTTYRGLHTAPLRNERNTIDDLSDIFPDDIYNPSVAGRYYGHGEPRLDNNTAKIIARLRGKPETEIEIYRAVPKGQKNIHPGDWVTVNKDYAQMHGDSWVENGNYDVISKKVKAKDLATDGNSIHEFGYDPQRRK